MKIENANDFPVVVAGMRLVAGEVVEVEDEAKAKALADLPGMKIVGDQNEAPAEEAEEPAAEEKPKKVKKSKKSKK